MALRLAVIVPLIIIAMAGTLIAVLAAAGSAGTGLAEDQRLWFFLMTPPLYLFMSVYVSSVLATWLFGGQGLPAWMRRWLERARPNAGDRDAFAGHDVPVDGWSRVRLAIGLAVGTTVLLVITVPVYALLAGWLLRPGIYAPWEWLMVAASLAGTIVWLGMLVRGYRSAGSRLR